jgi:hypothetical protein
MRTKDQILLEDAYEQVLNEGLGKALATGLAAASMFASPAKADKYPQDMDGAAIQSMQEPEESDEGAYEEVIEQLRNLEIGDLTKYPPIDKILLLKAANIKDTIQKTRLTDLIQLRGYKVPEDFGTYRVLDPEKVVGP